MTQSIIRFALIGTISFVSVSPVFAAPPDATKQDVKTEVKQEVKAEDPKAVKVDVKEKEKAAPKKKANEKECCQMKIRKL